VRILIGEVRQSEEDRGAVSSTQKLLPRGAMDTRTDIEVIAAEALVALDTGQQVAPFSGRRSPFPLEDAYRVTAAIRQIRERRGEIPVGRKIGFTNRAIWAEYRVDRPIWGYVYNHTVHNLSDLDDTFPLTGLAEPRIEPEIVFRLAGAPAPGMDEGALLKSIDWVAHGFEIVQSIFPGWNFALPDTVAAFGLHGALLIGPRHSIAAHAEDWGRTLSSFEIDLKREGRVVDHGLATNVLGGPVSALRYLIDVLSRDQINPPLAAGEIVTTGTLTRAFPIAADETWTTELTRVSLDGICVRFA
jgi:2-oxo-3-hexenedioate decarboxylase